LRYISLFLLFFVNTRKPLSTHDNKCVSVTSGTNPNLFRGRNTVEKYGEQHYPIAMNWIWGK